MTRFRALSLIAKVLGGHQSWSDAAPMPAHDAIFVSGGHGLAAA